MQARQLLGVLSVFLVIAGCSHDHETMSRPSGQSVQRQADSVDDLVRDITQAPSAAAEADAIRKLQRYEADHGLTYTTQIVRIGDNVPLRVASVGAQPVTATVTVFQGRDMVRRFAFIPKDNANLALLGA
jgi:hypothetical protein